jgi:phosphate starvation-inducible PhoH-like protein
MAEKTVSVQNTEQIWALFGNYDENINTIQRQYDVVILSRGGDIKVTGESHNVEKAISTIQTLLDMINRGETINEQTVRYITSVVDDNTTKIKLKQFSSDGICVTTSGKVIKPKTIGQKQYVDAIKKNTIVFGVGPAGTGKTYLAVALAVKSFKAHDVNKIILTRPAVEAGEKLGFLPGDLQDKVDPYLRPLYDGLSDMLGMESFQKFMEKGTIEVAPLAYMRGRTLENAFIILDEAQNTTPEQIKMFLTRLGNGSRMVITGDVTQIDLPNKQSSGLIEALKVLKDVDDISIQYFTEKDVVRHRLVQEIIKAYENYNNSISSNV